MSDKIKASEAINKLKKLIIEHGDLPIACNVWGSGKNQMVTANEIMHLQPEHTESIGEEVFFIL